MRRGIRRKILLFLFACFVFTETLLTAFAADTAVPVLEAEATRYNTIALSWDKVPGAKGYEIYYSTSENGEYRLLRSLTRNTYKYTKAACGVTYYFKVCAYQKSGKNIIYSDMSDVVSASTMLAKPEPYVYKTTYNSITLKWPKVTGAASYQVLVSDSVNGPFEEVTTVKRNSYIQKKAELGKSYYYKVKAIRKDYVSAESDVIHAQATFEKLTGAKASGTSTSKIKGSWKRVVGVEKYVVERYRSLEDAEARVNCRKRIETTKTYITDSDLLSDTNYYYRVYGVKDDYQTNFAGPVIGKTKKAKERYGIDVSSYQGTVDWNRVSDDGIDFAMLRILVKNGDKDSQFEQNYKNARKAGVKVGVYRYSYATSVSEAKEEAREVVKALNGRKLDFPVALDLEDDSQKDISPAVKAAMVKAYRKIIQDAGYRFVLYANLNWLNNYIDMRQLDDVDIWIARYRSLGMGHGYNGYGTVTMWQYSSVGHVDGIAGKVDLDVCYKDY